MKTYRTVIFDLDGTLLNTIEDLTDSVNHVMDYYNYPKHSVEAVTSFVGHGLKRLMQRAVPEGTTEERVEEVFEMMRQYYTEHCQVKTRPYDGIMDLLRQLKTENYRLAIVSNKNQAAVTELNKIYFDEVISVAIGQSEGVAAKPAPDSVFEAMRQLGVTKEEVIYVGDSEVDKETADRAGVDCILVSWGFRGKEAVTELAPTFVVDHASEIYDIVSEK